MIKYLFICSSGRSGSTLLDLLLGSHSKIASLGEISHLPKNISLNTLCSCGKPVKSCDFWKQVASHIHKKLDLNIFKKPYSLKLGYIKPQVIMDHIHRTRKYQIARKIVHGIDYLNLRYDLMPLKNLFLSNYHQTMVEHNKLLYDVISHISQKQMVVDSTKSYLKCMNIYGRFNKNTRIIFLTRDGRGVMYSNIKSQFNALQSIRTWKNYYLRSLCLLKKHVPDEHIIQIKYEDLVDNPKKVLNGIYRFLELSFEKETLDFAIHVHHITNGNEMRFTNKSKIKADVSWKQGLSRKELELFNKTAGSLNRQLGYH